MTSGKLRQAEARLRAWEAAHHQEPKDEHERLPQIRDWLSLESLPAHTRAYILEQRPDDLERRECAQAILEMERRAQAQEGLKVDTEEANRKERR